MPQTQNPNNAKGSVILTLSFHQDGKNWLGKCLELGTSTYASTMKSAHEELAELVTLHLNALEDAGERERFFKENSIKFYSDRARPTEVTRTVPVDETMFYHQHAFPVGATC